MKGRPVSVWHPFRVAELRALAVQGLSYAQAARVLRIDRGAVAGAARRHAIPFGRAEP